MAETPLPPSGTPVLDAHIERDERRVAWLLGAAAVTAVITLALVLTLGLQRPPELAALAADQRLEHALAILAYRDGERGQCLDVVTPAGEVRELRCSRDGIGSLVGWDERGILIIRFGMSGERIEAFDPASGSSQPLDDVDPRTLDAQYRSLGAMIDREGGVLTVRDGSGDVRWSVEVGDGYRIESSVEHPTTGDLALIDNAGRLLLLAAGTDEPRVWVADIGSTFGEMVWEGTGPTTD